MIIPDSSGFWKHLETEEVLEIYPLEPVMNTLCVWCQDVGISYTEPSNPGGLHQTIWTTDEWLGHIPITRYLSMNYSKDDIGWVKI